MAGKILDNGALVTLGLVGVVAAASLAQTRGSAAVDTVVLKEVLHDFLFGSRVHLMTEETYARIYAESDAYGLSRSAPLGDWSGIRDASPSSLRVMLRILTDAVGREEIERALRDHVSSSSPAGKVARVIALAKRDAKHVAVEPGLVIADFTDGRLLIFPQTGHVFRYSHGDFTSGRGAFSTLHSVGGWTSSPRTNWAESAHREYEDIIRARKLDAGFPVIPPPKVKVIGVRHEPMPQGWKHEVSGRAIIPRTTQVPSMYTFR
jgi:hypothetical protein